MRRIYLAAVMKTTLQSWLTVLLVFCLGMSFCDLAQAAQSAQDLINAEGKLKNMNQRPTRGDNSDSAGTNQNRLNKKDQAWNLTREGQIARQRYERSNSSADYQAATDAIMAALAKSRNYGPAFFQLCYLYSDAKNYSHALSACTESIENGGGGKQYPYMKPRDIRRNWIPYLQLMQHRQEHDTTATKYFAECRSGGIAGQFSAGFRIATEKPEQGGFVYSSADFMKWIASCQRQAAALAIDSRAIDNEAAAYEKSQKGQQ